MQEEADRTVKYVPGGSCVITASQKKECMTATATVRPIKGPDSPGRETTREGTLGLGNANTSRIALSTVTSSLLGSIAIESTPLPRTVPEIVPSPGPGRLLPRGLSTFDPDDHRNIKQHRNHHHLHYIKNNKAYRHPKSQPFQPKNIPSSRTAGTKLSRSCLVFDPGKVLNGQRTVPASLDPSESTHRDPLQPLYSRSQ